MYNNFHSFLGRNEQRFDRSFLEKLDRNGAVSFYLVAVKRWLAIRLVGIIPVDVTAVLK